MMDGWLHERGPEQQVVDAGHDVGASTDVSAILRNIDGERCDIDRSLLGMLLQTRGVFRGQCTPFADSGRPTHRSLYQLPFLSSFQLPIVLPPGVTVQMSGLSPLFLGPLGS